MIIKCKSPNITFNKINNKKNNHILNILDKKPCDLIDSFFFPNVPFCLYGRHTLIKSKMISSVLSQSRSELFFFSKIVFFLQTESIRYDCCG